MDSIVDIKEHCHGVKFKLEMCCECCQGRAVWYSEEALFESGNQYLQDLARQTVQLHKQGLKIAEKDQNFDKKE